ncbi:MAG: isoprenyl transferase [Bacteroidales bacterium]|nr:isoprenyl transferase [Bacteroidales bacterium]MCF8327655.1 isoprenyl transferase [Bacteroidales bacterium]
MPNWKEKIDKERLPKHIAIIMDGNGRWARKHDKPRVFGHQNGVTAVRNAAEAAAELGVDYLTLYAFSTENWNRPKKEVNALMELLVKTINSETDTLLKNKIKLNSIGDISEMPQDCYDELKIAIDRTADNDRMTLNLALNYSGRWDITQAGRRIAQDVKDGVMNPEDITDEKFNDYLDTTGMPDVELLIRTSGEQRISNFLLWQVAYAELYFTPKLWPEFTKEDLHEAIVNFQCRERRFGKTSEQLTESRKCE